MKLVLHRMSESRDGTFGRLETEEHEQVCFTLEEPWVDVNHDGVGDRGASRVPPGVYTCVRYRSPKRGYDVFVLQNVPGRSMIEIHIGNTLDDTEGCILVGNAFASIDGRAGLSSSRIAFKRLMTLLQSVNEFTLEVVQGFGCGS